MTKIPPIPTRNKQFGSLVGFTKASSGSFNESVGNYEQTEGGIDYNAGLVAALGYIVSKMAPVDTSKFGSTAVKTRMAGQSGMSFHRDHAGWQIEFPGGIEFSDVAITDGAGRVVWSIASPGRSILWPGASKPGIYVVAARSKGHIFRAKLACP
jgi:hypothetical protein